jgi:hypothetical protein
MMSIAFSKTVLITLGFAALMYFYIGWMNLYVLIA